MEFVGKRKSAYALVLILPALHLVVVLFLVVSFWAAQTQSQPADGNIASGLLLFLLVGAALPWSLPFELLADLSPQVTGVVCTLAALLNVVLHTGFMILVRRADLRDASSDGQ